MSKKDFAEFHRLLALLKYDCVDDLFSPNISNECRDQLTKEIEAIDLLMQVCRIEKIDANPILNNEGDK